MPPKAGKKGNISRDPSGGVVAQEPQWEDVYMVSFANAKDFPDLKARGINVVLLNVSHDPVTWDKCYGAAVTNNLRLIPILWGTEQTAWQWNPGNAEWELDRRKYPDSIGAKSLDFLRGNPRYLSATPRGLPKGSLRARSFAAAPLGHADA